MKAVAPSPHSEAARVRLALAALALGLAAFYLATMSGHLYARDEETLYLVAEGLVEGRGFTISPQAPLVNAVAGVDGQRYAQHPPGQAIAAIPLYLVGKLAAMTGPPELRPFITRLYVQTFNVWITALLCAATAWTALLLGARLRTALLLALLLGLTTMQWVYARTFFAEPLTALLTLLSFAGITRAVHDPARRWLWLSGLAAGLALIVKPHSVAAWPALGLYLMLTLGWPSGQWQWPTRHWWGERGRRLVGGVSLWLTGWLPPVVLQLLYNAVLFGDPLVTGNTAGSDVPFDASLYEAIYGVTLSSGKGIIFYAPIVVAGLVALYDSGRSFRWATWSIWLLLLLNLLIWNAYRVWYGGGSWGPRYLLLVLPFLLLPLAPWLEAAGRRLRARRVMVALLALAGVVVQVLGLWTNFATPVSTTDLTRLLFVPSSSPIVLHAQLARERWQQWQAVLFPRPGTAVLLAGFSYEDIEPSSPASLLPLRALPPLVLSVRPAAAAPLAITLTTEVAAAVQLRWDGQPVAVTRQVGARPEQQVVTASVPGVERRHDLQVVIERVGAGAGPSYPLVTELRFTQGERELELLQWPHIPPMPQAPLRRWQWFHVPNIPHLADHWLWYVYASGVTRQGMVVVAMPLVGVVLGLVGGALWCLWRLRALARPH